jgi:hypothetical protein
MLHDDEIILGQPRLGDADTDEFRPLVFDEHDDDRRGLDNEIIDDPLAFGFPGAEQSNTAEILGAEQEAILRTLARARDNRRPCPPMRAVDLDAPLSEEEDVLGAEAEAYPLFQQLLEAWRQAGKPRIVRVDTEADHQAFRDSSSKERLALLERMARLEEELHDHLLDPDAHSPGSAEALQEAEALAAAEEQKRIPMRMPKHFDGLMEQWHERGMAQGAMLRPRPDNRGRWVVTATEAVKKGELEAAKAATEAGVPAAAIVGYLCGIGASLAAADATKSLAAGAVSLLSRPEARGERSFLVRLDPQVSPAVFALAELCRLCDEGDAQACAEWNRLAAAAPAPLREAMAQVKDAVRGRTAIGGAVSDFFEGLWSKIRAFFRGSNAAPRALPAPAQKALPQRASA